MRTNGTSLAPPGAEGKQGAGMARPDPEVLAKPKRRRFSAAYKLRVLAEAEQCSKPGELGPAAAARGVVLVALGCVAEGGAQRVAGGAVEEARAQAGDRGVKAGEGDDPEAGARECPPAGRASQGAHRD